MRTFDWKVAEAGYDWAAHGRGSKMDVALVARKPWPKRATKPLQSDTGLFIAFSRLRSDKSAMLSFASMHGHLGEFLWVASEMVKGESAGDSEKLNTNLCARHPGGLKSASKERIESYGFWCTQVECMRVAVEHWTRVRKGESDPDELPQVVDKVLLGMRGRADVVLVCDAENHRCHFDIVAHDLLGAMWGQFAEALISGSEFKDCTACQRPFQISAGGRSDRQHCSLACRQRAYRERKELSLRLLKKGRTFEEVSTQLETPIETIRGWAASAGMSIGAAKSAQNRRHLQM